MRSTAITLTVHPDIAALAEATAAQRPLSTRNGSVCVANAGVLVEAKRDATARHLRDMARDLVIMAEARQ